MPIPIQQIRGALISTKLQSSIKPEDTALFQVITQTLDQIDNLNKQIAALLSAPTPTLPSSTVSSFTNIPFSASLFSTNSTGSITPTGSHPFVYRYSLISNIMLFEVGAGITINNGTTTEIRCAMPTGFGTQAYDPVSGTDDNQTGGAGTWNNNTTAGVTAVLISQVSNYISIQRSDGVLGAGFPSGTTVFVRFNIGLPVVTI